MREPKAVLIQNIAEFRAVIQRDLYAALIEARWKNWLIQPNENDAIVWIIQREAWLVRMLSVEGANYPDADCYRWIHNQLSQNLFNPLSEVYRKCIKVLNPEHNCHSVRYELFYNDLYSYYYQ